jgi:hypothetical protein
MAEEPSVDDIDAARSRTLAASSSLLRRLSGKAACTCTRIVAAETRWQAFCLTYDVSAGACRLERRATTHPLKESWRDQGVTPGRAGVDAISVAAIDDRGGAHRLGAARVLADISDERSAEQLGARRTADRRVHRGDGAR